MLCLSSMSTLVHSSESAPFSCRLSTSAVISSTVMRLAVSERSRLLRSSVM